MCGHKNSFTERENSFTGHNKFHVRENKMCSWVKDTQQAINDRPASVSIADLARLANTSKGFIYRILNDKKRVESYDIQLMYNVYLTAKSLRDAG